MVQDFRLISNCLFSMSDHPIHPPSQNGHPFDMESLPESAGYQIAIKNGICQVFRDEDQPMPWIPFDLSEFLIDQNVLFALMTDGPL